MSLCNNRIRAYDFFHWSSCHTFKKSLLFEGFFSAKTSSISILSLQFYEPEIFQTIIRGPTWTFGLKRPSAGGPLKGVVSRECPSVLGLHYQRLKSEMVKHKSSFLVSVRAYERLWNHRDSRFRNHASRTIA